jgi:hypothetical protein
VKWQPFKLGKVVFDLSHLDPFVFDLVVAPKDDKPVLTYSINVEFSMHCFTRDAIRGEVYTTELEFRDGRERRLFSAERYYLSKRLPEIIRTVAQRKCYHARDGNFLTVEIIDDQGIAAEYSVFFKVARRTGRNQLTLYVQTAYVRGKIPVPERRPIQFRLIAFNVSIGRKIKKPI